MPGFLVQTQRGPKGPFKTEKLRRLFEAGKLKERTRLVAADTGEETSVAEVLAEDDESHAAPPKARRKKKKRSTGKRRQAAPQRKKARVPRWLALCGGLLLFGLVAALFGLLEDQKLEAQRASLKELGVSQGAAFEDQEFYGYLVEVYHRECLSLAYAPASGYERRSGYDEAKYLECLQRRILSAWEQPSAELVRGFRALHGREPQLEW